MSIKNWSISLSHERSERFSEENHRIVVIDDFLDSPGAVIDAASLQKFAKITPQYPGIRSPLPKNVSDSWAQMLSPLLNRAFGNDEKAWETQVWFSIVTTKPGDLVPMQRLPHVDGTDPRQLAMMLYLDRTEHGGTGFFRHRTTGLESLTDANFPRYRAALEDDVRKAGMPKAEYTSTGEPHFERIHASEGAFNQAIFYRGNVLHSGLIKNDAPLSSDPAKGRLTINAFFRPIGDSRQSGETHI